ncbi:hypothetical protein, partial [Bradyrhizobium diazoefficiens]
IRSKNPRRCQAENPLKLLSEFAGPALTTMNDQTAETARLMKVAEAIVREMDRQGIAEAVADLGFDVMELARVAIRAADGDVISFRRPLV